MKKYEPFPEPGHSFIMKRENRAIRKVLKSQLHLDKMCVDNAITFALLLVLDCDREGLGELTGTDREESFAIGRVGKIGPTITKVSRCK